MAKDKITVKVKDIPQIFGVVNHLSTVNNDPFKTRALQLLYRLQPEMKFLQSLSEEKRGVVADQEYEIGLLKLPCPEFYGQEHEEVLKMICEKVEKRKSEIEDLIKEK